MALPLTALVISLRIGSSLLPSANPSPAYKGRYFSFLRPLPVRGWRPQPLPLVAVGQPTTGLLAGLSALQPSFSPSSPPASAARLVAQDGVSPSIFCVVGSVFFLSPSCLFCAVASVTLFSRAFLSASRVSSPPPLGSLRGCLEAAASASLLRSPVPRPPRRTRYEDDE